VRDEHRAVNDYTHPTFNQGRIMQLQEKTLQQGHPSPNLTGQPVNLLAIFLLLINCLHSIFLWAMERIVCGMQTMARAMCAIRLSKPKAAAISNVVDRAFQRARWFATSALFVVTASGAQVITTVDSNGSYTSLQLNAGNAVVSYYDGTQQDLKLATCTANCASASPTWQLVTVDSVGTVGQFTSLQLNGGNPIISYYDVTNGDLKLATCTAACASATPTWQIVTVDSGGDVGQYTSLRLNAGNPVISYRDVTNLDLKLATCTANCASASPTWQIVTVDSAGNVGADASLQLNAGNPVISYFDAINSDLKLATCTAGCTTVSPTWQIVTVDAAGTTGFYTSLQLNGGNPVVSYYDTTNNDLRLATCTANCASASPTWQLVTVDSAGSTGWFTSLQLDGGNPVISYYDATALDLRLARCTAACATAAPSWQLLTVESAGNVGQQNSLQLNGTNAVISYRDSQNGFLKLATLVANIEYTVTPNASANGTITPPDPQLVQPGETQSFIVTPNAGYVVGSVGGTCPAGSFSGSIYTTAPINASCTVIFSFALAPVATQNVPVPTLPIWALGLLALLVGSLAIVNRRTVVTTRNQ
jgi:hypothetical protein